MFQQKTELEIINSIQRHNNIYWLWGIENTYLVLENAIVYTTISGMLFSIDINFFNALDVKISSRPSTLVSSLNLDKWSYIEFVCSAFLFCMAYEIEKQSPDWTVFIRKVGYLLINTSFLGAEIFNLLVLTSYTGFFYS